MCSSQVFHIAVYGNQQRVCNNCHGDLTKTRDTAHTAHAAWKIQGVVRGFNTRSQLTKFKREKEFPVGGVVPKSENKYALFWKNINDISSECLNWGNYYQLLGENAGSALSNKSSACIKSPDLSVTKFNNLNNKLK
jgi:ABC-type lipoprotein release transport system permease subunit